MTRGDSNCISVHFRNLKSWSPYTARERLTHTRKTRRFSAGRSWYCSKVADSCAMNIYKRQHAFDVARTLFFLRKVDSFNCTFTNRSTVAKRWIVALNIFQKCILSQDVKTVRKWHEWHVKLYYRTLSSCRKDPVVHLSSIIKRCANVARPIHVTISHSWYTKCSKNPVRFLSKRNEIIQYKQKYTERTILLKYPRMSTDLKIILFIDDCL